MPLQYRFSRGFSLLEMMTVVTLILVLATFSTPVYHTVTVRTREAKQVARR
jgi:prepilin-type N-terminal cleavage/methylation domain-containing protein